LAVSASPERVSFSDLPEPTASVIAASITSAVLGVDCTREGYRRHPTITQRRAARLYCHTESGAKMPMMITTQVRV
jgi:hypothetical protein